MQESGGAEPCRAFACVCKAAGRGLQPKGGPEMVLELVSDRKSLRKHMDTVPPVQLCHVRYQQLRDLWAPLKMLEFTKREDSVFRSPFLSCLLSMSREAG